MTVLRDHLAGDVHRFAAPARRCPAPDPTVPLTAKIEFLEQSIIDLRQHLVDAEQNAIRREAAARLAGRRDAVADEEARVQALVDGMAAANTAFDTHLAGLEQLAGDLANLGLTKVFGDTGDRGDQVAAAIRHAIADLRSEGAPVVTVSPQDFDADAIESLRGSAGPVTIAIDATLVSGEARIAWALGESDVSPGAQWARLREVLRSLEGRGVCP